MHHAVAKLEAAALDALAREEEVSAPALQFLLRRYQAGGDADLGDAVGGALARTLTVSPDAGSTDAAAARLVLFVEAASLSDDERFTPAIDGLVTRLRAGWTAAPLHESAVAIGAWLHAVGVPGLQTSAADAIDALEHVVGRAYRPGSGVGGGAAEVYAASALLTAYSVSGRLPYPMLAEELIQSARGGVAGDFAASCEAARVLCRLAALHDDADYRAAAILAPGVDYRQDAAGLLDGQTPEALRLGHDGAIFGLAFLELESGNSSRSSAPDRQ